MAPHPDDEAIGAAILIRRVRLAERGVTIVFVTDGVPTRHRLSPMQESTHGGYGAYVVQRAEEAAAAVAHCGADEVHRVGLKSREVIEHMEGVASRLREIVQTAPGAVLVGPAFEGGHPDHDLVACLCDDVSREMGIPSIEYLGYHWREGKPRYQEFRPAETTPWVLAPTPEEVRFKAAALATYASQQEAILHEFRADVEAFRWRPVYYYDRSELGQRAFYEIWGAGIGAEEVLEASQRYLRNRRRQLTIRRGE